MLTGSIVSSLHGEPRLTHDIDFIVSIPPASVSTLVQKFQMPDYYLDPDSIQEALRHDGTFNLIEVHTSQKADFYILTGTAYDQTRFARRQNIQFLDREITVASPEDSILSKLDWAKRCGGSEKQMLDVQHVYARKKKTLDVSYIEKWAATLGITELWQQIIRAS